MELSLASFDSISEVNMVSSFFIIVKFSPPRVCIIMLTEDSNMRVESEVEEKYSINTQQINPSTSIKNVHR